MDRKSTLAGAAPWHAQETAPTHPLQVEEQLEPASIRQVRRRNRYIGYFFSSVWLVFIIFPLYFAINSSQTGWRYPTLIILVLAIAPVFLYVSFRLNIFNPNRPENSTQQAWVAALIMLVILLLQVWVSGQWDFFASASFIMGAMLYSLPVKQAILVNTSIIAFTAAIGYYFQNLALLFNGLGAIIWVTFALIGRIDQENREKAVRYERQRLLAQQREHIAQDVHDLLGHSLTAIALKAQVLQHLTDNPQAQAEAAEIATLAREGLQQVRLTVSGLKDPNLAGELTRVKALLGKAGIDVQVTGDPDTIPQALQTPLAWVLREASTNAIRYSQASKVRIELGPERLVFADDGIGLEGSSRLAARRETGAAETGAAENGVAGDSNLASVSEPSQLGQQGHGLAGMRQRLADVDGDLQVSSELNQGVTLTATWPGAKAPSADKRQTKTNR
ncbi:hypothetical protein BSR28_04900 [Boudabousia liubingyangii]|uniref:histidine kinase n=1 Tax=Boudabousia liubingyangii TaxID=1921764 RepID=UPI00093C114E|nr:histidine kinase [Boudabousia liubingyangii]OKL46781.1 hypothetical protein BSR28_04900 [Boudabousia liubingyangii]